MKKCKSCENQVEDSVKFCPYCGSGEFITFTTPAQNYPPQQQFAPAQQQFTPAQQQFTPAQQQFVPEQQQAAPQQYNPAFYNAPNAMPETADANVGQGNGNILLGILGAVLFSIASILIYILASQLGVVSAICGFITYWLASLGYRLFAKTKNKSSVAGIIVSVVITIIMIYLGQYVSYAFLLYQELTAYNGTFADAWNALPLFLQETEVSESFVSDIGFMYVFFAIGTVIDLINLFKKKK